MKLRQTPAVVDSLGTGESQKHYSFLEGKNLSRDQRLFGLQYEYCHRIKDKKIPCIFKNIDLEAMTFEDILDQTRCFSGILFAVYRDRTGTFPYQTQAQYEMFEKSVLAALEAEYQSDSQGWLDKIPLVISNIVQKLPNGVMKEEDRSHESNGTLIQEAGILDYVIYKVESEEEAEKVGLNMGEYYLEFHLNEIRWDEERIKENASITTSYAHSLQKLAKDIMERYPQVKLLRRHTWLIDERLPTQFGFQTVSIDENLDSNISFWGQFFRANGAFNMERVNQFLETGVPPFRARHGQITRQEFLERFLPDGQYAI